MNEDVSAIDRDLLRRRDPGGHQDAQRPALLALGSQAATSSEIRVDITAVLDAIKHAALSMTAMAERIKELEANAAAFTASNDELEAQGRKLAASLGEANEQCDALAVELHGASDRLQRLEALTAHHMARSTGWEQDLAATRAALRQIIDAVGYRFGQS